MFGNTVVVKGVVLVLSEVEPDVEAIVEPDVEAIVVSDIDAVEL